MQANQSSCAAKSRVTETTAGLHLCVIKETRQNGQGAGAAARLVKALASTHKASLDLQYHINPGVVTNPCSHSTREIDTGGSEIHGCP